MKYLLHCIFQPAFDELPPEPGMCVVAAHGLAAVVSRVEETSAAPSVSALLAYEKVVETMHARQDVLPVRYGCLLEGEREIVRLLEDRRQEYEALLGRLRGMTEMGIRVLWPARPEFTPASPLSPGARYLAALRNRSGSGGGFAPEEAALADQITGLLSGCCAEQQREVSSSSQGRLVSLYLLTRRSCVERVRTTARHVRPPGGAKLLLSGPWPPYNFAATLG